MSRHTTTDDDGSKKPLIEFNDEQCVLSSPSAMPLAAGFLWNSRMMIHITARGFATAQFMQPEPAKYAHAPIIEAKHFMLPEQGTYQHHPGRYFFVKDRVTGSIFSAPYEPVRARLDVFNFIVEPTCVRWLIEFNGIRVETTLSLPVGDVVELWEVRVTNLTNSSRRISLYPAFPLGIMSWMNRSAKFVDDFDGIVADCITAYQKTGDYFKNKALQLKDKTFLLSDRPPVAYETRQAAFEGEGGLHNPDGVTADLLSGGEALYENPIAALQFNLDLPTAGSSSTHRFIFGPARNEAEIELLRERYLSRDGFESARKEYADYMASGAPALRIATPDAQFDSFVNTWLPRQVFYHGDTNRLSTDPQTRNFLQDAIGNVFIRPDTARRTILKALSQQNSNGSLPDGIKLYDGAELKFINTVPHVDHCVWLPLFLEAYLAETDDYAVLSEQVLNPQTKETFTVRERTHKAMRFLSQAVDHRNLHYILEGDWNDPMNMVGYKGRGVSGWMSVAAAFALKLWAHICESSGEEGLASRFVDTAEELNEAVNKHLWDGDWFARGITDDDVVFGVKKDEEGAIYLNPQSFAILSGAASHDQLGKIVKAVEEQLEGPYGVEMLGPSYTHMREDVGRLTEKFPGVAENGSFYNHAAAFYIYSLFEAGATSDEPVPDRDAVVDRAFSILRRTLPGPNEKDYVTRGQLPVFVPNYYRGAYRQYPQAAGRSSHLFNTGTAAWWYRVVVEGLFGLKGTREGLHVDPRLPSHWPSAKATRTFRGAEFDVEIVRKAGVEEVEVECDGKLVEGNIISGVERGKKYKVLVRLPPAQPTTVAPAKQ